jgi:hypothetical protein
VKADVKKDYRFLETKKVLKEYEVSRAAYREEFG